MKRRDFVAFAAAGVASGFKPRLPFRMPATRFVERWSWAMGQPVHAKVFAASEAQGLDACAAVFAELRRVEARLTGFDDASDVSELNRRAGKGPMRVDQDLGAVLRLAEGFRRETGGAFNVGVEPLLRAWGFRAPRGTPPTPAEIEEARAAVAAAVIELRGDQVRLPSAHTQVDLGGIGVGYGIDRTFAVLADRGIRCAFLDVSGDCAALGAPPGEAGWAVDLVDPRRAGGVLRTILLRDRALATSANTETVVHYGRRTIGHVMNPVTGWPAHALVQTTVIARSAVTADALSTALLVNGRRAPGMLETVVV